MKTIWKFELTTTDEQVVTMPAGADILSAQVQHGTICLWALVDDSQSTSEQRRINIYGTGHAVGHAIGRFVGTVMLDDGNIVLHVFEVEE